MRASLTHVPSGLTFRVLNAHCQADTELFANLWKPVMEAIRVAQMEQLTRTEKGPAIVLGDWNTEFCRIPGWHRGSTDATFPATDEILDHCATWGPWELIRHQTHPLPWSDHYPVHWILRLHPPGHLRNSNPKCTG